MKNPYLYRPEKQRASLEEWKVIYAHGEPMLLLGVCRDHPKLPMGEKPMVIRTSLIEHIDIEKEVAVTKNTIYRLKTPYKEGGELDQLTKELGYEKLGEPIIK